MKIGILTFHWGTNYGAILQAWCLQEYLTECGHKVEIINYKPLIYDFRYLLKTILLHPCLWKSLPRQIRNQKKEKLLVPFRENNLNETHRFSSVNEFGCELDKYEVLISGSDQVLNPSFTLRGDNGHPSPAYWLGIGNNKIRRIGYAVSFGYESYPEDAIRVARNWIDGFDALGVREYSGLKIVDVLGYKGKKIIVPDPTLLIGFRIFEKLRVKSSCERGEYTCIYMLRHEIYLDGNVKYIDEIHHPLTMEEWLTTIYNAKQLVTNSYHGMIIAILSHVPFAVLLETGSGSGMNDRFKTLLSQIGLINRIAQTIDSVQSVLEQPIDFEVVDKEISNYRQIGIDFLKDNIKLNKQ